MKHLPVQNAGSSLYTPFVLRLYDWWVLRLSNTYAWRCSTSEVQLPLFKSALGERHLDIGVGTGYLPANAARDTPSCREITLVDLNSTPLDMAARRIAAQSRSSGGSSTGNSNSTSNSRIKLRTVVADATEPLPLDKKTDKFDSVSLFQLLHCMPGPPERKTRVFDAVREHVAEDGVLVGTTVLGEELPMNWLARLLMGAYNRRGFFDNWKDSRGVFEAGLRRNFEQVDVRVVGRVMVFSARRPKTMN